VSYSFRQRGATLVVSLILLIVLTMLVTATLVASNTNLRVVGNMQAQTEALNAAQQGVDAVISRTDFVTTPAAAVVNPCGTANQLCVDKDGNPTINVASAYYTTKISGAPFDTAKPACIQVRPIKTTELVYTIPDDQPCFLGAKQQFGTAGATSGDSLCAASVYQITAETTGANGATASVTQGVGIRISVDAMETSCL